MARFRAVIVLLACAVVAGIAAFSRAREGAPRVSAVQSEAAPPEQPWLRDEAENRGLRFRLSPQSPRPMNIQQTLGTGVAFWDYDGDGYVDAYLVGQRGASASGGGALFRNRGDGTFEDRTAGSGLDMAGVWHGCAVADVDNDGRADILLTGMGECRLFRNLGGGKFRDVTPGSGIGAPSPFTWATSASFADVDRDGLVDVFIGRYVRFGPTELQLCSHFGVMAACGPKNYDAQDGSLYRNLGGCRFEDVTARMGLTDQHGKTLGAAFGDLNDDGFPDLYLANDEMPGDLYLNHEGRRFTNIGMISSTALSGDGHEQGGMGVDWGDYDRDGRLDLFVTTFQNEPKSLYRNLGQATFEATSVAAGVALPTRPFVGFGTRFVDLDDDGYLDLVIANGHMKDNIEKIDTSTTYRQRSQVLRNVRGARFEEVRGAPSESIERAIVGRGLAVGDVDHDGDPDVLISDLEGPPLLLINRKGQDAHWLSLRLVGSRSNRMGIGARVRATAEGTSYVRECQTGGSFLSASDPAVQIGLGQSAYADLEIHWPSGAVTRRRHVAANQFLTIREAP